MPPCPHCHDPRIKKDGRAAGRQRYRCHACRRTFTDRTATPFAGFHWYCRYRLSPANVVALLAERGIDISARTVLTWMQPFGPLLAHVARRRSRQVGTRWWCDEPSGRVTGRWAYLDRAVNEAGQVIDVLLREHRDLDSATTFLVQAIERRGVAPTEVIADGHQAYQRAVREAAPEAVHIVTGLHRAAAGGRDDRGAGDPARRRGGGWRGTAAVGRRAPASVAGGGNVSVAGE